MSSDQFCVCVCVTIDAMLNCDSDDDANARTVPEDTVPINVYTSSYSLCNRRKTLTVSLDPTCADGTNKPCTQTSSVNTPLVAVKTCSVFRQKITDHRIILNNKSFNFPIIILFINLSSTIYLHSFYFMLCSHLTTAFASTSPSKFNIDTENEFRPILCLRHHWCNVKLWRWRLRKRRRQVWTQLNTSLHSERSED